MSNTSRYFAESCSTGKTMLPPKRGQVKVKIVRYLLKIAKGKAVEADSIGGNGEEKETEP